MSITTRPGRRLCKTGVALIVAAGTFASGIATVHAQGTIETQWFSSYGRDDPYSFVLGTEWDDEGLFRVARDATGTVTSKLEVPSNQSRELQLALTHFPSVAGIGQLGSLDHISHADGMTTMTFVNQVDPASVGWGTHATVAAAGQIAEGNWRQFGHVGTISGTTMYSGDNKYRPTVRDSSYTVDPEGSGVDHVGLTFEVAPRSGNRNQVTLHTDTSIGDRFTIFYSCSPFREGAQGYVNILDSTLHEVEVFDANKVAISCASPNDGPRLVYARYHDADSGQMGSGILAFDAQAGGSNVGVDVDSSLAPNQQLQVSNLAPSRSYKVQVHSSPREIGALITDAEGVGTVVLPNDLADGNHELIILAGAREVYRHPFTFSQRADPARTVNVEASADPGDPGDPGEFTTGSLGSLTGSVAS